MTERTPDERRPHARDEEDQPEVEGHVFRDHERRPHAVNEDEIEDEGKAGKAGKAGRAG